MVWNGGISRVRKDSRALRTYSRSTSSGRRVCASRLRVVSGCFARAVAMSHAMPMRT